MKSESHYNISIACFSKHMGIGFLPLRASQMKRREDMAVRNARPAFTLPRETRPNGAGASMSSSVTANGKRPKKIPTIIFNEDSEGVRRRQDTPPPIILPGISYSTTTSATTAPSDSLSGGTSSPSADSNLSNQWETPRTHLKLAVSFRPIDKRRQARSCADESTRIALPRRPPSEVQ